MSARLRWQRDDSTPARFYTAGPYQILYDPAGPTEGETGGWYLSDGTKELGIYPTLKRAKEAAEEDRQVPA